MALKSCEWSNILLFFFFFSFKSVIQFCALVLQETTDSRCCLCALAEGSTPSGKAPCPGAGCGLQARLLPCWAVRPSRARPRQPLQWSVLGLSLLWDLFHLVHPGPSAGRGWAADWVMMLCWVCCRCSAAVFSSGFKHTIIFYSLILTAKSVQFVAFIFAPLPPDFSSMTFSGGFVVISGCIAQYGKH